MKTSHTFHIAYTLMVSPTTYKVTTDRCKLPTIPLELAEYESEDEKFLTLSHAPEWNFPRS